MDVNEVNGIRRLPAESTIELGIRNCLEEIAKDSQQIESFPKLISLAIQYCDVKSASSQDTDDQEKEAEGDALVFRPHQLCHRCETDRQDDEGKKQERSFRFDVQTCMLRGLQFRLKGRLASWFDALSRCIYECQDCCKGLWRAREQIGPRFLRSFPQSNVDTFVAHTLTWEEGQALRWIGTEAVLGGPPLFAILELAGVLYSRDEESRLYKEMTLSHHKLQIQTLPEPSTGLLALAICDDEIVREWALKESSSSDSNVLHPTASFRSTVKSLLVKGIERQRWDAVEFGRKLDTSAWSDAELPNTLVSLINKDKRRTTTILEYFRRHLEQKKRTAWRQEDARYPLVILSAILSSGDYMTVICASSNEPGLFSWASAFLDSIVPHHAKVKLETKQATAARDRTESFGEALKQVVYFLLERLQQASVPITVREVALQRCFVILESLAAAFRRSDADADGAENDDVDLRAIIAAVQQVTSTHSTLIANVAFRGKLPNSADTLDKEASTRRSALSFVKHMFELDSETMVEKVLQLSEQAARQQRSYKRLSKDVKEKGSAKSVAAKDSEEAIVQFFEKAVDQLKLDVTISMELWKDSYNSCVPRHNVKSFLDPLAILSPFANPQINSHIISDDRLDVEMVSYIAYKDALKAALLGLTRRLRAMRGSLPMLLLDLSEDFSTSPINKTEDLPTICFATADGLMAANLSADVDVHKAAQNVVRTAFEDAETRADCFRSLLQCNPTLALKGIKDVLESFVIAASSLVEANDAAKWLVRSFSDILEVLCSDTDGLLRSGTPFSLVDRKALHRDLRRLLPSIWMLMCKSIAIIFQRTPSWSRILPHKELTAWFRDVLLFATEAVDHLDVVRSAATCGMEGSSEAANATRKEMEADMALPLEEASSWFRINDLAIVQETRDFFVRGLQAYQRGSTSTMPAAVKDRMLKFIDSQINVVNEKARFTLLTIDELAELRALLDPTRSPGAESDEEDGFSIVDQVVVQDRKSDTGAGSRTLASKTLEGPSSQEKARMKQARLSFAPVQSDVARKQPFVSKAAPLPPQPRFPTQAGTANRYQSAGAKPATASVSSRMGKIAQLRQDFVAQRRPSTTWKPVPTARPASTNRDQQLPEAPEAKRSFNAMINMPSAAAAAMSATSSAAAQSKVETESGSDSSDSDEEGGAERVGLAHLGDGQRSPAKLLPKVRTKQQEPGVRRSAIVLEDRSAIQAQREKEEAERKRKLREYPNFAPLHRTILSWDFSAEGNIPPSASNENVFQYATVRPTYANAQDYVATFEPMLLLECWADVQQAREQVTRGAIEHQPTGAKLIGRANIDAFDLLTLTLDPAVRGVQQVIFQDTDVIYVREASASNRDVDRTFLAKVDAFKHAARGAQVTVRSCVSKDSRNLSALMMPGTALQVGKLFSLTTLHREYEALHKLRHFEILPDILFARAAIPEQITPSELAVAQRDYGVNEPQARAIVGAIKAEKGFHLIQGPPGTGKTKTICSLVAHFMKNRKPPASSIRAGQQAKVASMLGGTAVKRKILLCAPSNAAVDEVARRAHQGVRMPNGEMIKPVVVRVGREEAMNVAVKHISLDSLIEQRLTLANAAGRAPDVDEQADPAQISAEIRSLRDQLDLKRAEVENARLTGTSSKVIEQLEAEKRNLAARRLTLMEKMDVAKDQRQTMNRQKDADRRRIQQEILMQADVICATLGGAGHPTLATLPFDFETVVIDEAAQAVELDTLIPLRYGCQRCIMVGDPKQLPPTVISREAERMKYSQSLFVRLFNNANNRSNLLSIQYRMHPYISQFPSEAFYEGRLRDGPDMKRLTQKPWHHDQLLKPFRLFDCRNSVEHASYRGNSLANRAEAEMAARIYERLRQAESREAGGSIRSNSSLEGNVGVVTMYKDQVRELKRAFRQLYGDGIEDAVDFNTVDGFQGQEKDVIILSCVRSNGIGFLNDFRRINVAVTRAKSNLFIVANVDNLTRNDRAGFWQTFIDTARKNGDLMSVTAETFKRPYVSPSAGRNSATQHASPPRTSIDKPRTVADHEHDRPQRPPTAPTGPAEMTRYSSGSGTKRYAATDESPNGWKRQRNDRPREQPSANAIPLGPSGRGRGSNAREERNGRSVGGAETPTVPTRPKGNPIAVPGQPSRPNLPGPPPQNPHFASRPHSRPPRPRPGPPPSNGTGGPSAQATASMFLPKRARPQQRRQ